MPPFGALKWSQSGNGRPFQEHRIRFIATYSREMGFTAQRHREFCLPAQNV